MTVKDLCVRLSLRVLAGRSGMERRILGGYSGDLLSWVMSRARQGDAWITVMGNINAVAVAKLTGAGCIILCEDAPLDEDAKDRANHEGIPVLAGSDSAFRTSVAIYELLSDEAEK